ncbi:MAG: hypothetical protein J6U26_01655, partial [Lachnospiraceae bacterium]|nr:hypothetical protein [Lachnospiraceae bacterium]
MRKKPFLIVLLSLVLGLTALPARALPLVQTAVPAVSVRSEQTAEDVLIAVPDRLAPANLPVLPDTGADPDTPALLRNRGPLVFPTDSAAPSDLPASYLVATTPIRDQGANDLCWAFSTYGVMESWLLNHGHGSYDLSEMHMAYATSNHSSNPYGFYRAPADGGNRVVATSYLMRGTHKDAEGYDLCIGGAVLENEDPYSVDRLPDRPLADTFYYKEKVLMPENALFLSGLKNEGQGMTTEDVKQAILQYGAVGAAMTWDKSVANGTTGNGSTDHYNAATAAYYLNTTGVGTSYYMNHMVTIVGWDDAFPRESFNENCRPSSNGAWRIRNSWGTDWGDGGFAWISYEDADFPSEIWAITGITGYDSATMRTHEYDYAIDTYGYWSPFETNLFLRYFEVTEAEDLTSVRVFLPAAYSYVEVDVIPDFMNTDMSTYTFRTLTGLSARYPGWYTINLPYPQPLTPLEGGTRYFAVVIRSSNPLAYDLSCRDNSMFCMDGYNNWYYTTDPNYPSEGWCIKAVCETDPPKVTGWIFNDGDWYYFDDDGVMQTGWNTIGGKVYYFDGSGAMQTGWKKIDGLWYYFDENGAMQTGWLKTGGKWYFLDSSGALQTGWLKSGGRWYYLDGDGVMITGWLEDGGK